ncbi:MAG: response regulator transcription factor [Sphingobacterium sp.]|jgi:DNA-binding LytR/AlgR family response regulator|nr:response regulator transcription factor [Sphingobacterium sp.]
MKILIVDDEPIAQEVIQKLTRKIPFLEVVGICDDAFSALEMINSLQPDLIFLDIQMPGMTGVEMLHVVQRNSAQVIFTTAYPEYALEGFDLNVTDYLLKPIPFERFFQAVNKAHVWYLKNQKEINTNDDLIRTDQEYIWVKEGKKHVQIRLLDVVIVRALADYMEFIMPEGKVMVHATMSKLEKLLPAPAFIRVNRSTIVRQGAIRSIEDLHIETILPKLERIAIGSTYWESVKEYIKEMF